MALNFPQGQGLGQALGQGLQNTAGSTVTTTWPSYPKLAVLTDSDILLMATCIENDHAPMEGRNYCFCAAKRIEKGISKE